MRRVSVQAVKTTKDQDEFLDLPRTLYANDSLWVPPIGEDERELAGFGSHPFFEQANSESFIATNGGKVCGRITAIIHHSESAGQKSRHGYFGFFESIADAEVSSALFDAARSWLSNQGCVSIRGPVSPSITYQCGLLIDGYYESPTFLMPYNPSYYINLIEDYGFVKAQDLLSFQGSQEMLDEVNPKILSTSRSAIERLGINLRHFQMEKFPREIETFYEIYHQSLSSMWGFTPLNRSEIEHAGSVFAPITIPEFTVVAEIEEVAIGTVFGLLDFNPLIKETDGKLDWKQLPDLLSGDLRPSRVRIPCTLVLPQYALWGVGLAMLQSLLADGLKWGLKEVEFSWIAESNWLSKASLERGGARRNKTYRVYELQL